jgi:hypothetical protein
LWLFGIFYGYLVYFGIFCIFLVYFAAILFKIKAIWIKIVAIRYLYFVAIRHI